MFVCLQTCSVLPDKIHSLAKRPIQRTQSEEQCESSSHSNTQFIIHICFILVILAVCYCIQIAD